MRNYTILLSLLASLTASGCNGIDCGPGTIERNGTCAPADENPDPSSCGPFTHLVGETCVPDNPPTECGMNTMAVTDPETGIVTCVGTGGGTDCATPLPCPNPTGSTKQTICGQIYDFENMTKFAGTGAAQCDATTPTASGPCALALSAYDALNFASNPATATPLAVGSKYIDNCGRFKLENVETSGTGPYIGIGVDDAVGMGPTGISVTAAVATGKLAMGVTNNVEAFIVKPSTAQMWGTTSGGGVSLQTGVFATLFRKHKLPLVNASFDPFEPQSGVVIQRGSPALDVPSTNAFYFGANVVDHTTIDPAATATGVNGTGLVNDANVMRDSLSYLGKNGLGTGCRWENHGGASLPGIVYIQIFRKADIIGMTCND